MTLNEEGRTDPRWAIKTQVVRRMSPYTAHVLVVLAAWSQREDVKVWPTDSDLMAMTGLSRMEVGAALWELQSADLLVMEPAGFRLGDPE